MEAIKLDSLRGAREYLSNPAIKSCRKNYREGELLPCTPHTVIVTLTGSVMLVKTVNTDRGPRNTELRSYGPLRIPNVASLKSMGFASEAYQLVAETDVSVLEFDNRVDQEILRSCVPWFQSILIDQQGEDLGQNLYLIERDVRDSTNKEAELGQKLDEANARIAALMKRNRDLAEQHEMAMSVKDVEFAAQLQEKGEELTKKSEELVDVNQKLDLTKANLDATTRQLDKSVMANEQLRKMLPDVLELIEAADVKMREQAERFPEELNKILGAYNLPPRSPDEIMLLLRKIDRGEEIDPAKDLDLPQLEIVVEEDGPIPVDDSELFEDIGSRHTIPILEAPPSFTPSEPSRTFVSSGRTLPSGQVLETRQGVGERHKPILSTRQYPAPNLGPIAPKK